MVSLTIICVKCNGREEWRGAPTLPSIKPSWGSSLYALVNK